MNANFERALKFVLSREGGYVNHPSDPGGHTNKGITLATFREYTGLNKTVEDLKNISDATVAEIYYKRYWLAAECDSIPAGLDLCVFDFGVTSGPRRARRMYDSFRSRFDATPTDAAFVEKYSTARELYYRALDRFPIFGKGWLARNSACKIEALKMVAGL